MPQPMSTPTAAGMIALSVGITEHAPERTPHLEEKDLAPEVR